MACDISGIRLNAEFTNSELRNTYIANQYVRQIVATEGPPNQLGLQIGAIGNVFVGLWDFDLNQITGNAFFIIQGE